MDREMLNHLRKAGYDMKSKAMAKLRIKIGLYRRTNGPEKRRQQDNAAFAALITQLKGDDPLDDKGQAYMKGFAREKGLIISR
jgi:hypothetical protein